MTLTGQSRDRYPFTVYTWGTKFRGIPAVYYITKRSERKGRRAVHAAIYVGQTDDMSKGFSDHPRAFCFQQYEVNTVSVHQKFNRATRVLIETDLIQALNPPCNASSAG